MFPPCTKHFFNVLLFSFVTVTLYLPKDGVNHCGMIKHNEVRNFLAGGWSGGRWSLLRLPGIGVSKALESHSQVRPRCALTTCKCQFCLDTLYTRKHTLRRLRVCLRSLGTRERTRPRSRKTHADKPVRFTREYSFCTRFLRASTSRTHATHNHLWASPQRGFKDFWDALYMVLELYELYLQTQVDSHHAD